LYKFGAKSKDILSTCCQELQEIMNEVIKIINISVISGHRGMLEQDTLYRQGFSKTRFPHSKHNTEPSKAVDIMQFHKIKPHYHWQDREEMLHTAGVVQGVALMLGYNIRVGADWNNDNEFNESFFDGAHVEYLGKIEK